jgi:hypothetical protein
MRSHLMAVLGAVTIALTMASLPASGAEDKQGPVGADPITDPVPGDFKSWDELFTMQNRLNAAAEKIESARDDSRDDGYGGVIAAPQNRRLQLFWRGPIPPKVEQAIAAANRDVPVVSAAARYSELELLGQTTPIVSARGVSGVAPSPDGGGLIVSVVGSEEEGRRIPAVRDARVPITIEPFVAIEETFNRQDDIPPYWGGARYSTPGGGCSTGFGVKQAGMTRMLTAGHCGSNGQTANDGGGQVMGLVMNKNPIVNPNPVPGSVRDVMTINTFSAGRVYVNGWASSSSVPVKAKAASLVGNLVCTSGSFTGMHCPIQVTLINQAIPVSGGAVFYPMVKATHTSGKVAVGKGDSGGPVIDWWGHLQQATAKGTISAGSGSLGPCGLSSLCFKTVYYADITKTLKHYIKAGIPTELLLG